VPDVRDLGTNVKPCTADDKGVRPTDHNMIVSTLQIGPSAIGTDAAARASASRLRRTRNR